MLEQYQNRNISVTHPGFSDMRNFFLKDSPGAMGAMFGVSTKLELSTTDFLNKVGAGLVNEDAAALHFLYRNVADLTGSEQVTVGYDREGWPIAIFKGSSFPHSEVKLDMSFLMNDKMTWRGWISSESLVLPSNYTNLESLKGKIKNNGIIVDQSGFYRESADYIYIYRQLSRYPDLLKVVHDLWGEKENPLVKNIEDLYANSEQYHVYSSIPLSPKQEKIMKRYGVFYYSATVDCFTQTLNEIVMKIGTLLPDVEEACVAALDTFTLM